MAKKKQPCVSKPQPGDLLLVHMAYGHWFLRRAYLDRGGELKGRLIRQDRSRPMLYKMGARLAKNANSRLLWLLKSEIKANREINVWEVSEDYSKKK